MGLFGRKKKLEQKSSDGQQSQVDAQSYPSPTGSGYYLSLVDGECTLVRSLTNPDIGYMDLVRTNGDAKQTLQNVQVYMPQGLIGEGQNLSISTTSSKCNNSYAGIVLQTGAIQSIHSLRNIAPEMVQSREQQHMATYESTVSSPQLKGYAFSLADGAGTLIQSLENPSVGYLTLNRNVYERDGRNAMQAICAQVHMPVEDMKAGQGCWLSYTDANPAYFGRGVYTGNIQSVRDLDSLTMENALQTEQAYCWQLQEDCKNVSVDYQQQPTGYCFTTKNTKYTLICEYGNVARMYGGQLNGEQVYMLGADVGPGKPFYTFLTNHPDNGQHVGKPFHTSALVSNMELLYDTPEQIYNQMLNERHALRSAQADQVYDSAVSQAYASAEDYSMNY